MTRTLVFGGARSGKSAYAEQLAERTEKSVLYVATARAGDGEGDSEMATRIALHRDRRNAAWTTLEEPMALGEVITSWSAPERVILIDCLTIWLSNLLFAEPKIYPEIGRIEPPACFANERGHFLESLANAAGDVILVSNEVGMGIVPQGAISRWFVDEAGRLNQATGALCDSVIWVAAGLPLAFKGTVC
jgi:adenosylcobinamide kinase/adenosylcobinamide-phosphate guanylyltransferase